MATMAYEKPVTNNMGRQVIIMFDNAIGRWRDKYSGKMTDENGNEMQQPMGDAGGTGGGGAGGGAGGGTGGAGSGGGVGTGAGSGTGGVGSQSSGGMKTQGTYANPDTDNNSYQTNQNTPVMYKTNNNETEYEPAGAGQQAGEGVGAAVGSYYGGAAGAYAGEKIGGAVGSVVDGGPEKTTEQKLQEDMMRNQLSVQRMMTQNKGANEVQGAIAQENARGLLYRPGRAAMSARVSKGSPLSGEEKAAIAVGGYPTVTQQAANANAEETQNIQERARRTKLAQLALLGLAGRIMRRVI